MQIRDILLITLLSCLPCLACAESEGMSDVSEVERDISSLGMSNAHTKMTALKHYNIRTSPIDGEILGVTNKQQNIEVAFCEKGWCQLKNTHNGKPLFVHRKVFGKVELPSKKHYEEHKATATPEELSALSANSDANPFLGNDTKSATSAKQGNDPREPPKSTHYKPDGSLGKDCKGIYFKKPVTGRMSSAYGYRIHPTLKTKKFHNGCDYAATTGTPIYAPYPGKIVAAHYKGANGNYIHLADKTGRLRTFYAHLSRYGKGIKKGVTVKRGQIIGYVGSTGRSTGPHLHLGVKCDGSYKNPAHYVGKGGSKQRSSSSSGKKSSK